MMPMPRTRLCTHLSGSAREVEERIRNLFRRHRRPPALRRCGQLAAPILTGAVRPVILLPDLPPGGAALQYGLPARLPLLGGPPCHRRRRETEHLVPEARISLS